MLRLHHLLTEILFRLFKESVRCLHPYLRTPALTDLERIDLLEFRLYLSLLFLEEGLPFVVEECVLSFDEGRFGLGFGLEFELLGLGFQLLLLVQSPPFLVDILGSLCLQPYLSD